MRIRIETETGSEEIELDLDFENLTMRESVRLEHLLGGELFDRMARNELTAAELGRPSYIQAMIYTKLKTIRPEVELDGFDMDLTELAAELAAEVVVPGKLEEPSSG